MPDFLPGENLAETHHKQALICSGKTPNLATPAITESHCCMCHQNAKHGGKNKWRQQHYLRLCPHHGIFVWLLKTVFWIDQWWSRWENLTFLCKLCLPGFKKQLHTSTSTANLKWHIELKHPASLSRKVWMNTNSKDTAAVSQNRSSTTQIVLTAYSSGTVVRDLQF